MVRTTIQGRESNGQYAESEPCEACGKPAGLDYWSLSSPNGGGLTLCNRKRCPAVKLSEWPGLTQAERETLIKALIAAR